jgi:hypothetical protein
VLALALVVRAQHEKDTFNLGDGPAIRAALVRWFRIQRKSILDYLHHLPGHRAEGPTELPSKLPNFDGDTPKMVEDMTPLITATWDKAGRKFREKIGLDPDQWKVINPHVKGKIQNATMAFCAETNATTSKLLNQALADLRAELVTGIVDEGEGLIELTKRVERVFENAETWRARRIAATENSRARHEAELESAVESEVVAGFQWLLSEGACALCYHISDQVKQMPLGENFAVIGHNEHYKNIRTPPLHPGCRCSQLAILKPEYGGPENPEWGKTAVQPKVEDESPTSIIRVQAHGDVPAHDVEAMQRIVDAFPRHLLERYRDYGGRVTVGKRITEVDPSLKGVTPRGWPEGKTWDNADGFYDDNTHNAVVTEEWLRYDKWVKSKRMPGVIRHELSHGIDKAISGSTNKDFIEAYEKDVSNMSDEATKRNAYLVQPGNAGKSEAFAELLAFLSGGAAGNIQIEDFPLTIAHLRQSVVQVNQ